MKTKTHPGKKEITLPEFFSVNVRPELILKVYVSSLTKQEYATYPLAGKQSGAGKVRHKRRKWKTTYGRGISRVPRKYLIKRGEQFYWIGAFIPGTVGGRAAHPPKLISRERKINKKEKLLALKSAISATASKEWLENRYEKKKIKAEVPIIIENSILEKKNKEIIKFFEDILGIKIEKSRKVRAGKGKRRNRKYKKSYSLLLVVENKNKKKLNNYGIETIKASSLSVKNLASGGIPGRLTVYTEQAISDLNKRIKKIKEEKVEEKKK